MSAARSESTTAGAKKKMTYVRLGDSGLKISRLVMGTMQYGHKDWQQWLLGEEEAEAHIKAAYDLGIQTFDTADVYSNGHSEIILGKVIKKLKLPRQEIVVMTKLGNVVGKEPGTWFVDSGKNADEFGYVNQGGLSRKHIFDAVKASLERLQLDYIDVLQCHRADPITPIAETMKALHDVVQAGYVRYIGMGSCWAYQFHAMQNYAINNNLTPFISMQNQYSLVYREDEREMYPVLKMFGVGSIVWSPLARGLLSRPLQEGSERANTDRFLPYYRNGPPESKEVVKRVEAMAKEKGISMAQLSIAWLLHKSGVTAPIVGFTSIEQLNELAGALDVQLTAGEIVHLEELYKSRPVMGFK